MKRLRPWILFSGLLLAVACQQQHPMWSTAPQRFVSLEAISVNTVLAAPPAAGSPAREAALQAVIRKQAHLSPAEIAILRDEDTIRPEMMLRPTLGERYQPGCYPALYQLLNDAKGDALGIGNKVQDHWKSPRPWTDARVQAHVTKIDRPSYPSGHIVTNTVWADTLSELFPAKRKAFRARADQVGWHRVEAGAHFPFDLEGGRKLAAVIYTDMKASTVYQQELAAARTELKSPQTANCVKNELARSAVPGAR